MMGHLPDLPLDELLKIAREVGALDRWETTDEALVFESCTMRIAIEEPKAKPFVLGLLRGYELALEIQERSQAGPQRQ